MNSKATTIIDYLKEIPEDRKGTINKLRKIINDNLPDGFNEGMQYGMIGYFVPHDLYPKGYHCNTKEPLPFINLASQKNSINFYHMGIYANKELLDWFVMEYKKQYTRKLDMGKSCIRFKYLDEIPFEIIAELCSKITVNEWINTYETSLKR